MNMPLLFDSTILESWQGNPVGIARVVQNLRDELKRRYSGFVEVVLNDQGRFDVRGGYDDKGLSNVDEGVLFTAGFNWDYEGHTSAIREAKGQGYTIATLFYDAIPVLFPHYFGPGFSETYKAWLDYALRYSDILLAISESTKRDIERLFPEGNKGRPDISVIRLGDEINHKLSANDHVNPLLLDLDRFLLSVGMIEFRKNHIILLNAYRLLIEKGKCDLPKLVIVGREGWMNHSIMYQVAHDPELKDRVMVLNAVSDCELDYLYRHCLFTLYPSLYEGWGLPIAESLRYGKQCIASNASSMVEISPGLTPFAHPLKASEWAAQIDQLVSNNELIRDQNVRIAREYQGTTWGETADQLLRACLGRVINE
jgi:glycosyltransferase involved in cell wall biosynthesis